MKFLRLFLLLGLLGIAWYNVQVYYGFNAGNTDTQKKEKINDADELKQKVVTFAIDGKTSQGLKKWHLEGKAAEIIGEEIHLEDLMAEIIGDNFEAILTSDKGIYFKEAQEVELIGNVRVVSEDNGYLTTDRAKWSHTTKEVVTDADVTITRSGMQARGKGARANSEKKTAKLLKDVEVDLEPNTFISCDGPLEVSFDDSKAVFLNNVHVTDKEGELFSDKLTVNIDTETKKIAEVIAENNVKLKKGNSYTVCGKAKYIENTGTIQFLDRPRIVIAPEELQDTGFLGDIKDKIGVEKNDLAISGKDVGSSD